MRWSVNLAWTIELSQEAIRSLKKISSTDAKRIRNYLRERIEPLKDPKLLGKQLKGSKLGYFWRYRVGAYCLICEIQHEKMIALVLIVGHRKDVYL